MQFLDPGNNCFIFDLLGGVHVCFWSGTAPPVILQITDYNWGLFVSVGDPFRYFYG